MHLEDCETRLDEATERLRIGEERLASNRDMVRLLARKLTDAREAALQAERASADLLRRRDAVAQQIAGFHAQSEEIAIAEEDACIALAEAPDLSGLDLRLREQGLAVAEKRAALAEARALNDAETRQRTTPAGVVSRQYQPNARSGASARQAPLARSRR